jgi:hypothetical protein
VGKPVKVSCGRSGQSSSGYLIVPSMSCFSLGTHSALPEIAAFDVGGDDSTSCSTAYPHKTLFLNGGKSKYLRTAHLSTIAQLFPTFSLGR